MTKNLNSKLSWRGESGKRGGNGGRERNGWRVGFTLIEMLISITILMLFLGIAASSYTTLVKANQSANSSQKIYREVRHVFDTLAQEIRGGVIDYSCIDLRELDALCLKNQRNDTQSVLSILHDGGASRTLYKFANGTLLALHQTRVAGGWAWENTWQSFVSDALELDDLTFSVFPLQNPYESANAGNDAVQRQPAVTIKLRAGGHDFRTTYTSRTYGKQSIYE